jgi:hypothetical protein
MATSFRWKWFLLAILVVDLQAVVAARPALPDAVKSAIVLLVRAGRGLG